MAHARETKTLDAYWPSLAGRSKRMRKLGAQRAAASAASAVCDNLNVLALVFGFLGPGLWPYTDVEFVCKTWAMALRHSLRQIKTLALGMPLAPVVMDRD